MTFKLSSHSAAQFLTGLDWYQSMARRLVTPAIEV